MGQAIDKAEWTRYCDLISRALKDSEACIQVSAPGADYEVSSDWRPWRGISYDPKDDVIDIVLDGGVDHIVEHPRELSADGDLANLHAIAVTGSDGLQHIVRVKDDLASH